MNTRRSGILESASLSEHSSQSQSANLCLVNLLMDTDTYYIHDIVSLCEQTKFSEFQIGAASFCSMNKINTCTPTVHELNSQMNRLALKFRVTLDYTY